jgi:hypothetical protein
MINPANLTGDLAIAYTMIVAEFPIGSRVHLPTYWGLRHGTVQDYLLEKSTDDTYSREILIGIQVDAGKHGGYKHAAYVNASDLTFVEGPKEQP